MCLLLLSSGTNLRKQTQREETGCLGWGNLLSNPDCNQLLIFRPDSWPKNWDWLGGVGGAQGLWRACLSPACRTTGRTSCPDGSPTDRGSHARAPARKQGRRWRVGTGPCAHRSSPPWPTARAGGTPATRAPPWRVLPHEHSYNLSHACLNVKFIISFDFLHLSWTRMVQKSKSLMNSWGRISLPPLSATAWPLFSLASLLYKIWVACVSLVRDSW